MKRLVGIFFIVQAIVTYLILDALNQLSVSISEAAVHMKTGGLTLSWSDDLPLVTYVFLIIIVILGIYFTLAKEKKKGE
ncbi:hypothetical protein [Solibacillus daqui]|uniref:hypothetical protein n=1 Tax=Solibacillus daqui TaxID=2912187 RepID=UPI002367073F|nr:hypothetical protein [Solibacillus daqui]